MAVRTAPFPPFLPKAWQLQEHKLIPLGNNGHTKHILEVLEFYPQHGVNMCAERVQALRWTSAQILIFHFYWVTIWLITITSV